MGDQIHETEVRLRVVDPVGVRAALCRVADGESFSVTVTDQWFVPDQYATYEKHESWIASGHASPVRVRVVNSPSHVSRVIQAKSINPLDVQRSTEVSLTIEDVRDAGNLLYCLGYRPIAIVKKTRDQFDMGAGIVCHLDSYPDFGSVLEIEVTSSKSFTDPAKLRGFARGVLGLDLEEMSDPVPLQIAREQLRTNS